MSKKFRVYASYVVELYHDVEAEPIEDAYDKVYHVDGSDYTVNKKDDWQIDRIEELTK